MREILEFSLSDYLEKTLSQEVLEEQIIVLALDNSMSPADKAGRYPMRLKAYSFVLVLSGEMVIKKNYTTYRLGKNTIMQLSADDIIESTLHSSDFIGYLMLLSPELKSEILNRTAGIRLQRTAGLKQEHPILALTDDETIQMSGYIERIKTHLIDKSHLYRHAIIKNEIINFLLDLSNSRWLKHGSKEMDLSRNEALLYKFKNLLVENCRQHREVSFYANELCITPDYLSKVIRDYDGGSAMKWIANAIVIEAEFLLRQPDKTVYEIALDLNFPDQSTFGKFFKRYTGKSPMMYRKGLDIR